MYKDFVFYQILIECKHLYTKKTIFILEGCEKILKDCVNKVLCGDAKITLEEVPAETIDCIITSPPYFGLRDYQVEGQIGLEKTPEEYVEHLMGVFGECKRILKKTGTFFLNISDTYFGGGGGNQYSPANTGIMAKAFRANPQKEKACGFTYSYRNKFEYQPKCMLMIPERVAFALIEDGWLLRNKICWKKRNHMPSSAKDRFSNAWEYIYFFVKEKKYYFDLDSVREKHIWAEKDKRSLLRRVEHKSGKTKLIDAQTGCAAVGYNPSGKNPGDIFDITTKPFKGAHFAVFPPELCIKPIKAGCPEQVCKKCGVPRERVFERTVPKMGVDIPISKNPKIAIANKLSPNSVLRIKGGDNYTRWKEEHPDKFLGWTDCKCGAGFEPGIVLDPFSGSGTVGVVAKKLGRNFILIDLKEEYCEMARKRLKEII